MQRRRDQYYRLNLIPLLLLAALCILSAIACESAAPSTCPEPECDYTIRYRCLGDTLLTCREDWIPDCGHWGVESAESCAATCGRVLEYPSELCTFEYSHCGSETVGSNGPGECWCRHPTDGRLARGTPSTTLCQ